MAFTVAKRAAECVLRPPFAPSALMLKLKLTALTPPSPTATDFTSEWDRDERLLESSRSYLLELIAQAGNRNKPREHFHWTINLE